MSDSFTCVEIWVQFKFDMFMRRLFWCVDLSRNSSRNVLWQSFISRWWLVLIATRFRLSGHFCDKINKADGLLCYQLHKLTNSTLFQKPGGRLHDTLPLKKKRNNEKRLPLIREDTFWWKDLTFFKKAKMEYEKP